MKKTVKTRCARMDHGGCALLVEVENERITRIAPDPEGSLSHGHICPKARSWPELLNHPQRLRRPLRRLGDRGQGQWEEITWGQALDLAALNLNRIKEEHGARAVAFCQGSPKGLEHFALIRLANIFGSPNVVGPQNVCHMPREIPSMLTCGFFPVADYDHRTEAVLVWGSNLTSTNEEGVINTRLLSRLAADRAKLIVVDPRRTELAERADLWLPIKPGTDAALALGFLHLIIAEKWFDRDFVEHFTHGFDQLAARVKDFPLDRVADLTGLEPDTIEQAARIYGQARPGIIQWGNGIEQNIHNFDTARALLCLMALTGNLDAPGGNGATLPPPVIRLGEFVRADLGPNRSKEMISAAYGPAPGFVIVPPEHFKQAVLTGRPYPVRAAYVHVSNPVLAWSDSYGTNQALRELDFLVVTETFLSPTARMADLVLPAATHFEYNDLGHFGLAHGYILPRAKVVEPPPECWPNLKIINELAKKLGLGQYWWDDYQEMLTEILKPAGISFEDLAREGLRSGPVKHYKYKDKGFKTPTGKVELFLSRAEKAGFDPLPGYSGPAEDEVPGFPLLLTGHKSRNFFCSDHRFITGLVKREPDPLVELHPETADRFQVCDGDEVLVETPYGGITVRARVTPKIRTGVLSVVHGWWRPQVNGENSWNDLTYNVLTSSAKLNRTMGTPNLRALPARLKKTGEKV